MSYIPVKINLTNSNKNKLLQGKGIKILPSQLNHGNQLLLHPMNYKNLKERNLNNFLMTQGELLATAQNNNLNGSGIFGDIGKWLSDNATSIFDTLGMVASVIPGIGPIASTVGREVARAISGKGL